MVCAQLEEAWKGGKHLRECLGAGRGCVNVVVVVVTLESLRIEVGVLAAEEEFQVGGREGKMSGSSLARSCQWSR